MTNVTTLDELLPLLDGATTARAFGAIVIAVVPTRPRGLRPRLALAARDALGHDWTDAYLRQWLSPRRHSEARVEAEREADRRWREENREVHRETRRRYYAENAKTGREATRRWLEENPDHYNDYRNKRRVVDPAFALTLATRNRVYHALRAAVGQPGKSRSTMELLGCSADELRLHLESLWEPGMTWQNWGPDGWHVDHVRPIASFDLSDPEQQARAFHYTNTQPMWADENLSKGSLHDGLRHRY